ncbi:MAG: CtsR family transcriptional regulator [Peptococcaceae bacterium]|jgi:transcriptional regulator CtsR|nr:CtsR family transcriptional regulator [Peptococcaceae bacterium]
MTSVSDYIERYLKDLLDGSDSGVIKIGRNELALKFKCVPSQINYVLTTRFSVGRGFCVESRKGGGGYIRIIRLSPRGPSDLMDTVCRELGQDTSEQVAADILQRLFEAGVLKEREAGLMKSVLGAGSQHLPPGERGRFRADLMRAMLGAIFRKNGK